MTCEECRGFLSRPFKLEEIDIEAEAIIHLDQCKDCSDWFKSLDIDAGVILKNTAIGGFVRNNPKTS